jgi:Sec-independent protein secretion pathway component TatC
MVPLYLLYELSIGLSYIVYRRRKAAAAANEAEQAASGASA